MKDCLKGGLDSRLMLQSNENGASEAAATNSFGDSTGPPPQQGHYLLPLIQDCHYHILEGKYGVRQALHYRGQLSLVPNLTFSADPASLC